MAQTVRHDTLCGTPCVTVYDGASHPSWRSYGTGTASLTLWLQPAGPVSVMLQESAQASGVGIRDVTRKTMMQIDRENIPALIELLQGAING
jgi:hypothetical protein